MSKTAGWDIGGAHVKVAVSNDHGVIIRVIQQPCPLWQGLELLHQTAKAIIADAALVKCVHVLTMTGELVDLFGSRTQGVKAIVNVMSVLLGKNNLIIFAGEYGFLTPSQISTKHTKQIASANYLASVIFLRQHLATGIFVDIGSTTTDIILFDKTQIKVKYLTDYQRLRTQELIYTGVVRTPVMSVVRTIVFQGKQMSLMAENFATMADVYRITGELNPRIDQTPSADNCTKTTPASHKRLARMLACDANDFTDNIWYQLAQQLKNIQLQQLQYACRQQLQRRELSNPPILVGAGVGKFLAQQLAGVLGLQYQDASLLVANSLPATDMDLADCFPAATLVLLNAQ